MTTRSSRSRFTYANVAATIALVISVSGGTAFAASKLLTGASIRNGSLTGVDIKNNTLAPKDLTAALRKQIAKKATRGATGAAGTPGLTGARGVSAWETIPAGTTVAGNYSHLYNIRKTSDEHLVTMTLPGLPSSPLTAAAVKNSVDAHAATIGDSAACTGTYETPTAPAGMLCLYVKSAANVSNFSGGVLISPSSQARGVWYFDWIDNGAIDVVAVIQFAWAYTA